MDMVGGWTEHSWEGFKSGYLTMQSKILSPFALQNVFFFQTVLENCGKLFLTNLQS